MKGNKVIYMSFELLKSLRLASYIILMRKLGPITVSHRIEMY